MFTDPSRVDAELAELAMSLLANEEGGGLRPPERLRQRLLETVEGPARYAPFIDRVARFFGIDPAAARSALAAITAPDAWLPGPIPGMSIAKIPCRAKVAGQTAVFLRSDPHAHCPKHRHLGEERLLILEGSLVESDGAEVHAGDLVVKPKGSTHEFDVLGDEPCIAAYLLEGGLELA